MIDMRPMKEGGGTLWVLWRIVRAALIAVLLITLIVAFTTVRSRLFEPLGEVSGHLGPLEESRMDGQAVYTAPLLTAENELLLVALQHNGHIVEYLQTAGTTDQVTIRYQGQTAVTLITPTIQIDEYPAANNWLFMLLFGLILLTLGLLIAPIVNL